MSAVAIASEWENHRGHDGSGGGERDGKVRDCHDAGGAVGRGERWTVEGEGAEGGPSEEMDSPKPARGGRMMTQRPRSDGRG